MFQSLLVPICLREEFTELVVGAGGGVPVVELQVQVQGLPVIALGLLEPPLRLRDVAELVVGAGGGVPVVELQVQVSVAMEKSPLMAR